MADAGKTTTALVTQALATLQSIRDNPAASAADRDAALEKFEALTLLMGAEAVEEYEGRTAVLTGLVAQLSAFTKGIQVKNPIVDKVNALTAIAEKAADLAKVDKKPAGG